LAVTSATILAASGAVAAFLVSSVSACSRQITCGSNTLQRRVDTVTATFKNRHHRRVTLGVSPRDGEVREDSISKANEQRFGIIEAIAALRVDVPGLIHNATHEADYSIFSPIVVLEDARLPSFRVKGLDRYRSSLNAISSSVRAACEKQHMEILSVSPPVDGTVRVHWRMKLWLKAQYSIWRQREVVIAEGYSQYSFDPWSAKIIRHKIDITNPPMPLVESMNAHQFNHLFIGAPLVGIQQTR
jgi:hypothetical protein